VEERVELEDGHVLAPAGPGLGLTLRRDFVARVAVGP
jgi:L-alanine-DL-glutamate epimerase-like enolase superfamily enzyme